MESKIQLTQEIMQEFLSAEGEDKFWDFAEKYIECTLYPSIDYLPVAPMRKNTVSDGKLRTKKNLSTLIADELERFKTSTPLKIPDENKKEKYDQVFEALDKFRNNLKKLIIRRGGYVPIFYDDATKEDIAESPKRFGKYFEDVMGILSKKDGRTKLLTKLGSNCSVLECVIVDIRKRKDELLAEVEKSSSGKSYGRQYNSAFKQLLAIIRFVVREPTLLCFVFCLESQFDCHYSAFRTNTRTSRTCAIV